MIDTRPAAIFYNEYNPPLSKEKKRLFIEEDALTNILLQFKISERQGKKALYALDQKLKSFQERLSKQDFLKNGHHSPLFWTLRSENSDIMPFIDHIDVLTEFFASQGERLSVKEWEIRNDQGETLIALCQKRGILKKVFTRAAFADHEIDAQELIRANIRGRRQIENNIPYLEEIGITPRRDSFFKIIRTLFWEKEFGRKFLRISYLTSLSPEKRRILTEKRGVLDAFLEALVGPEDALYKLNAELKKVGEKLEKRDFFAPSATLTPYIHVRITKKKPFSKCGCDKIIQIKHILENNGDPLKFEDWIYPAGPDDDQSIIKTCIEKRMLEDVFAGKHFKNDEKTLEKLCRYIKSEQLAEIDHIPYLQEAGFVEIPRYKAALPVNKALTAPPVLKGLELTDKDFDNNLVPTLRVYIGEQCNLRCLYCFSDAPHISEYEEDLTRPVLSTDQRLNILESGKSFGLKTVLINGKGEPMLDRELMPFIKGAHEMGIRTILFTNGMTLNGRDLDFFNSHGTTLVLKLNSLDEKRDDGIVRSKGAHKKMMAGIKQALDHGFQNKNRLGIDTVIHRKTVDGIPDIIRFCRERKIIPWCDMAVPLGRTKVEDVISEKQRETLYGKITEVENEFGYEFEPRPGMYMAGPARLNFRWMQLTQRGRLIYVFENGKGQPIANLRHENLRHVFRG